MKTNNIFQSIILLTWILSFNRTSAQSVLGRTDAGKRVILNNNGTWKYDKSDTSGGCNCLEMAKIAQTQMLIAKHAEKAAMRERYLAVADGMALKSKELRGDPEQKGLLALQAFNFNSQYEGYPYENNVYNGVYDALKTFGDSLTISLEGHQSAVRALATNRKDNTIISAGSDGKIIRWKFERNRWKGQTMVAARQDYQIYSIDISPDGNFLAVGGHLTNARVNHVDLYDLNRPERAAKAIMGYLYDIEDIHFTPDGQGFYARCNSGRSIIYSDLSTAREVIHSRERISSISLSPDGTKLAGGDDQGTLYIWATTPEYSPTSYPLHNNHPIVAVTFMADSRGLAVGNNIGDVMLIRNGLVIRNLSGHTSSIEQIRLSHSGQFMATSSKDGTTRLWNLAALNEQPVVLSDHDWICSVTFSADDTQLMTGLQSVQESIETTQFAIRVWPTSAPIMASRLCSLLKRNMTKEEWLWYAQDLPYEKTCPNLPSNLR